MATMAATRDRIVTVTGIGIGSTAPAVLKETGGERARLSSPTGLYWPDGGAGPGGQ